MKFPYILMVLVLITACTEEKPKTGNCPDWSSNSRHNYANTDFSNFGCSYTNNWMRQVSNKQDIAKGTGDNSLHESDRESVGLQKYMQATPPTLPTLTTNSSGGSSGSSR